MSSDYGINNHFETRPITPDQARQKVEEAQGKKREPSARDFVGKERPKINQFIYLNDEFSLDFLERGETVRSAGKDTGAVIIKTKEKELRVKGRDLVFRDVDGSIRIITPVLKKQERPESVDALKQAWKNEGAAEALEWLLKNASGGGDWRRLAMMRLDELKPAFLTKCVAPKPIPMPPNFSKGI